MRKIVTAGALIAPLAFIGSPAWADSACVTGSVASYEVSGFSCYVGSIDFSSISVTVSTTGSGMASVTNFTPFSVVVNGNTEYGLTLTYTSNTGTTPNSSADVEWTYNVTDNVAGSLIGDAYASLAGTTTGTGTLSLSEVLSNDVTLALNGAGTTSQTFTPIESLRAIKDQEDFSGTSGDAESSVMGNGFSEVAVPSPTAGAGLPGLILASGFLFAWRRNRRTNRDVSALLTV
jgi:hypothetical protein